MKSFKSLIVFIFIISIFINIISISESAKNKIQSKENNTFLFGSFLCEPCGKNDIIIELYEKGQSIKIYPGDCKKRNFYITLFSESTDPNRFSGSFSQYCNRTITHRKDNVQAKFLTIMPPYNFYRFGIIRLK